MCRLLFVSVLLPCLTFQIYPVLGKSEHELKLDSNQLSLKRSRGLLDLKQEFPAERIITKRNWEHHITDCIHMTSEEGDFYQKAREVDGTACGVYLFSEPDQNIHIQFNYLDVPCDNGGLVAVVDGWELNREIFPSPSDHSKPLTLRFQEFCGNKKIKETFMSSQNVALIQYRMPTKQSSFSFNVRFVKNPNPCNVLLQTGDMYTLRNYGKNHNCSVGTLSPAVVKIADLNVGITPTVGAGMKIETGTIHKCRKRGLEDYVQIGGSSGLDNANLQVADSICGLSSKPGRHANIIACDTTSVRLVSSGEFDNSVTIYLRQLNEADFDGYMDVICLPEDMKE